jgi:hypothetical protein
MIQPPYESLGDYIVRLRSVIVNQGTALEKYIKCLKEANSKVESLSQALRDIQDFDPNCYGKDGSGFDCPYCVTVKAIGEPYYEN